MVYFSHSPFTLALGGPWKFDGNREAKPKDSLYFVVCTGTASITGADSKCQTGTNLLGGGELSFTPSNLVACWLRVGRILDNAQYENGCGAEQEREMPKP